MSSNCVYKTNPSHVEKDFQTDLRFNLDSWQKTGDVTWTRHQTCAQSHVLKTPNKDALVKSVNLIEYHKNADCCLAGESVSGLSTGF